MKRWSFWGLCLLAAMAARSETVLPLPEVNQPDTVVVDAEKVYVVDKYRIYIYSLQDFKLVKKLGRRGEGPGEFRIHPGGIIYVDVRSEKIVVSSNHRVTFFDKSGKYMREINNITARALHPFGKGFVGNENRFDRAGTRFYTVNLYNPDIKATRQLYRMKSFVQPESGQGWKLFQASFPVTVFCDDHLFVNGMTPEFVIHKFDASGQQVNILKMDLKRLAFTDKHQQTVLNRYKANPSTRPDFPWWKKNIYFPKYFPAIRNLSSDGQRLYVRTYRAKGEESQFIILNPTGEKLKTVFLRIGRSSRKYPLPFSELASAPYTFHEGHMYQILENEDTETFELHIQKVALN
jgi:hypothetical protein